MVKKKINERFQDFSVVLNVRKGETVNWELLKDNKIVENMIKLKFPTPMELGTFFKNFEGIALNSNVDKSRVRRFRFERFIGQLEKVSNNGRPHYNLSVMTSCKVLASTVVCELLLALYDVDLLKKYCLKSETRLVLPSTIYYPQLVDVRISEFIEGLEEDKELKKFMTILVCTNE